MDFTAGRIYLPPYPGWEWEHPPGHHLMDGSRKNPLCALLGRAGGIGRDLEETTPRARMVLTSKFPLLAVASFADIPDKCFSLGVFLPFCRTFLRKKPIWKGRIEIYPHLIDREKGGI